MFLFMALTLNATLQLVSALESEKTAPSTTAQPQTKVFQLGPDDVTAMIASSESMTGNMKRHSRSANVVVGYLEVSRSLLERGKSLELAVTSIGTGSKRWFALDPIKDVKGVEKVVVDALRRKPAQTS